MSVALLQMTGVSAGFLWGPCYSSYCFLCYVICFVSLRYVSWVPKVDSFSGLSIRDFLSIFSNVH